jgi:hypothetical protein
MEARQKWGKSRQGLVSILGVIAFLASGCLGLEQFLDKADLPPAGKVCQIVATWHKEVVFAPDVVHNGIPQPGITGRLYLFGPQIDFPLTGDGSLIVDLYTPVEKLADPAEKSAAPNPAGQMRLLEQFRLDKVALGQLLNKDTIGWGYSLFLPWGTYKPEITQIRLRVRYDPKQGTPLFTESGPLTLAKARGN